VEVTGAYAVENGEVRFRLGSFDRKHPLVIDPTVSVAATTFLEGSALEDAKGIAVDLTGNSYVVGSTLSQDFPTLNGFAPLPPKTCVATVSVPLPLCAFYAFVTKLSPAGVIQFSTYFGGSGNDFANAVAADSTGVYVAGGTASADFPVFFSTYKRGGN